MTPSLLLLNRLLLVHLVHNIAPFYTLSRTITVVRLIIIETDDASFDRAGKNFRVGYNRSRHIRNRNVRPVMMSDGFDVQRIVEDCIAIERLLVVPS